MRIKKISITHIIVCSLLLFFAFMPTSISLYGMSKYIRLMAQIGCLVWGIVFFKNVDVKADFFILLLILFQTELVASAVFHHTSFTYFARIAVQIISICILLRSLVRVHPKEMLISLMIVLEIYALINLIIRISDRPLEVLEETGPIYLLGSDNEATSPLILLLICSVLYFKSYQPNVLSVLGIVLPLFTGLYSHCGTAIMAYAVFLGGVFILFIPSIRREIEKHLRTKSFIVLYAVYYFILFSIVMARFTSLGDLINRLTGKNALTFTGRDEIWIEAINVIRKNLLFGIGFGNGAGGNGVFVRGFWYGAHNLVLQWGVNGGIVAVIMFLLILILSLKRMERLPSNIRYLMYLGVLTYLIAMSMENYANGVHLLPMLTLLSFYKVSPESRKEFNKVLLRG